MPDHNISRQCSADENIGSGKYPDAPELPVPLSGPLAWTRHDLRSSWGYTWHLSDRDISDIKHALDCFNALGIDGDCVSTETFPVGDLAHKLEKIAHNIHNGVGFSIIKGLHHLQCTTEDSVIVYLGLASYVADQRGIQDKRGNVLSHITSSKGWDVPVDKRHGIHSNKALPFHNDMGCDTLALQVRQSVDSGGDTYLASTWTVFNKLLKDEPDVARTLLDPSWPVQLSCRRTRHYLAPAFALHDGRLMACMDPNRFGPHENSPDGLIPALTSDQKHALQRVCEVARSTELRLKLETGCLLFLNNWALLHRRDAYQDDDRTCRHMVRLWLRNTQLGWAVPEPFLPPWQAAYSKGFRAKTRVYALYPMTTYVVPKYSAGSAAFIIEDSDDSEPER